MLQELAEHLVKYLASSVAAIGVGTLAVMGMSFFIARLNRLHTATHSDSKDRRETAYHGLRQAVESFTRQTHTDLPLILRSDWAHMAHALAASEVLAAGIVSESQREIWRTQLDYCRKLTFSGLQTQEAVLDVADDDSDTISRFNQKPSEADVAAVVRWALEFDSPRLNGEELADAELAFLASAGLPLLANRIRAWRIVRLPASVRMRISPRVTSLHN
jgi:hypothetical protein